MPILGDDYWGYLLLCGDELAADAPALFDPRNPLLALAPSTPALEEIVALLSSADATQLWVAPDTLGWTYQFFNTSDERRLMREGATAPRTSRELAVRNQFFTPRYVVDFLVQNTLGRRLIENDPTSALLGELPLLVDPPTTPGPPLDLSESSVLDPACGSGHFLLGCYDLLERAWELRGVPPSESAPVIVASLWGVDIDPRCSQVASAAVVLRARRHCRDLPLPRPNIITARSLPAGPAALPHDGLTPAKQRLLARIREALESAPLLGTLLKAEDAIEQEIRHAAFDGAAASLPLTDDAFSQVETDLMAHLQAVADQASSSVAERLLAAEADDALRLLDVVRNRYDVVLMNPPFGEPVAETKPYLRAAYPWIPTRDYNLLAAFVGRGLELCRPDGYVGAITSRAGMFLTTSERWRRDILLGSRMVALADLGYGVMEGAQVEAAAYVLGSTRHGDDTLVAIRVSRDAERPSALREAVLNDRGGRSDERIFRVALADIERIPGAPLAYWVGGSVRAMFVRHRLIGKSYPVRTGLQSGGDEQCIRLFWEIDPRRIARTRAETLAGLRWAPIAKGGENNPYWSDVFLLIDWKNDGELVKSLPGAVVRNSDYYFQSGLTWTRRAATLAPRVLPAGCIITTEGPSCFTSHDDALALVGWLNLRVTRRLADLLTSVAEGAMAAGGSPKYEVGVVQRLPWPVADDGDLSTDVISLVRRLVEMRCRFDEGDESARRFIAPELCRHGDGGVPDRARAALTHREEVSACAIEASYALENVSYQLIDLDEEGRRFVETESGPHPGAYGGNECQEERFSELYGGSLQRLTDAAVHARGVFRSLTTKTEIANRRLELVCHALGLSVRAAVACRKELGLLPPDEAKRGADDLLSYLVGIAFGRWDVRIGGDPSLAPAPPPLFDPVPLCPPGMLLGTDGFPVGDVPPGYPLELPPGRLLLDEPGHSWDAEAAVLLAAEALFDGAQDRVSEMLTILGRKTLRDHLRRQFFKDHLSRYSKSRRKAPIYWPLSVPSRSWGVWIYAPMLSRETLYAVASEAARRERLAVEAIARLQREQQEGNLARPARKIAEELDSEEKLSEELRRFRTEAERIAGLGWRPNLDDGVVLCAAPLADLFPAWPDANKARDELRNGDHEWAAVARWAEDL